MAARQITLRNAATPDKYGVVTIADKAGAIVREYRITGEELKALQSGKIKHPPGCTLEEWTGGPCYVAGCGHEVGDYDIRADGTLRVMFAETQEGARLVRHFAYLDAGEAMTRAEGITATLAGKQALQARRPVRGRRPSALPVLDIADGVLTFDDGAPE